jgi:hypothetical protein
MRGDGTVKIASHVASATVRRQTADRQHPRRDPLPAGRLRGHHQCRLPTDRLSRPRENLAHNLSGRAAFAHRFDSDNGALKPMLWGFDAFFFDTALLPSSDLGFAIGDPWWDIWFPMSFEIAGVPIETIDTPLVIHRIHPIRWNWLRWIANGNQFWAWLQEHKTTPLFGKIEPAWWEQRRLSREQLGEVNRMIVAWLRDHRPQTEISVMPAAMGTVESMLRLGGRATVETAYTRQIEKELDAIKRSTFWRATGPFRTTVTVFRKISTAARGAVA